jgi:replication factor C subunit 3/5
MSNSTLLINIDTHHDTIEKKESISKLPWIEKFRPKKLDDVISHNDIVDTLKLCVKKKTLTHLLFYGPPGTGKTSTIMACVRELYGVHVNEMVMELNASDDRGIECVREKIKGFVSTGSFNFNHEKLFKLVILDEMDNLTYDAQAGLRKMIEDHTENARFCLICNYTKNIDPALLSRCASYRFPPLAFTEIREKCVQILKNEKIPFTAEGLNTIIKRSNGDMRVVLNSLQVVSMGYGKIDTKNINECLGFPKIEVIENIFTICTSNPFNKAFNELYKIKSCSGISLNDLINELCDVIYEQSQKKTIKCFESFDDVKMASLLINLCNIQYYLIDCDDDYIHLSAVVGAFYL